MARGKAVAKPPAPAPTTRHGAVEPKESTTCPLCIEEMDSTDLSFTSCPCGYRICLFCYSRVKELCSSLCPGCRREYSDAVPTKPPAASSAEAAAATTAHNRAAPPTGTAVVQPPGRPAAQLQAKAVPAAPKPPPAPPPRTLLPAQEAGGVGLPSGATWGTQTVARAEPDRPAQPAAVPIVADESAWPSLAATAAAAAPTGPQPRQLRALQEDHAHRRSTSHSSSMDRVPSTSSLDQMGQDVGAQPHGDSNSVMGALVSTSIFGQRRTVNVDLPPQPVQPYPEAIEAVTSINLAMRSGSITSHEATAQLLSLLEQRKAPNGISHLAGKPPPGFAPMAAQPPTQPAPNASDAPAVWAQPYANGHMQPVLSNLQAPAPGPGASILNPLENPVVPGPPSGRYMPIGTRPAGTGQAAPQSQSPDSMQGKPQQQFAQQPQQQASNGYGTYSVWSGLPGIAPLGGYNPLVGMVTAAKQLYQQQQQHHHLNGYGNAGIDGLPAAAGGRMLDSLQAGVARHGELHAPSALGPPPGIPWQQPQAAKAPPPGFGPAPTAAPQQPQMPQLGAQQQPQAMQQQPHAPGPAAGAAPMYRPLAMPLGGYNPFGQHPQPSAAQWSLLHSGVPAYRPHLGAQL